MNKKIEDYLHLYLGCEVTDGEHIMKLLSVGLYGYTAKSEDVTSQGVFHRIKPLLRPLHDAKKEEVHELFKVQNHFYERCIPLRGEIDGDLIQLEYEESGSIGSCHAYMYQLSPRKFHYLLSKGFDLFNLIPVGLAIDKTKNNQ